MCSVSQDAKGKKKYVITTNLRSSFIQDAMICGFKGPKTTKNEQKGL